MSYITYKLIHYVGIFTILVILAATSMHALHGGTRADKPHRRLLAAVHGIAVFLVLLGGFGMLSRLGIIDGGFPNWVLVKMLIWLVLAAVLAVPYLGRSWARMMLVALPLLAVSAGALALLKPI